MDDVCLYQRLCAFDGLRYGVAFIGSYTDCHKFGYESLQVMDIVMDCMVMFTLLVMWLQTENLLGDGSRACSIEELQKIEKQLERSVSNARARKYSLIKMLVFYAPVPCILSFILLILYKICCFTENRVL